jgi:uncharacterized protein YbaA (DUF1428 family)
VAAMTYVMGFVVAVPSANKEAYRKHAAEAAEIFRDCGATRLVEAWGDDVPEGKVTDFKRSVQAKPDEAVLFSWIEFPDKATADSAHQKMMEDPRMEQMGPMPFDGQRMIYGGFTSVVDEKAAGRMGYVDGTVMAVPTGNKQAFLDFATTHARLFREYGATRVIDTWGVDVPDGKITDFRRSVQATPDETVAYGWVEWPSKQARDEAWQKLMADARMHSTAMPFDGKRMIYGGFSTLLDA